MCCKPCLFAALMLAALSCGGDDDGGSPTENLNCAPAIIAFPANVNSTFPNTLCTVSGKQARFLKFTASAGEARFDIDADADAFTPEIAVMKEGTTEFVSITGSGGSASGTWLLPAGTFVLRVLAASGTAGAFSISGVSTTIGCLQHALLSLASATYNNRIETPGNTGTGDCLFPDRNYDQYLVYSPKPCTITMRGTSAGFDATLFALNPQANSIITSDDNSGGGTSGKDARISLPSCRVGTTPILITATVSEVLPLTNGAYTLTVEITGGIAGQR